MHRIVPTSLRERGGSTDLTVKMVVVGCMAVSRGDGPSNFRTWTAVDEAKASPTVTNQPDQYEVVQDKILTIEIGVDWLS